MKKTTINGLLIILFLSNLLLLQAQQKTGWQENDLKGKVKSIHQKIYKSRKNKEGKIKLIGMKAEQKMLFDDDGTHTETLHRYIGYGGNGKWKTTKYLYNNKKQCIGFKKYNGEKLTQSCEYTLKKGRVMERKYVGKDGELLGVTSYSYNKKGLQTEEKMTAVDGTVMRRYVYEYDRKGRLIEEKGWRDGKLTYREATRYFKKAKNKKEVKRFGATDKLKKTYVVIEQVTEEGKQITRTYYDAQNKLTKKETDQYDPQGSKILRRIFNGDGSEQKYNYMRYNYRYDKSGNWNRIIEYLANGNSLDVSFREIEYY